MSKIILKQGFKNGKLTYIKDLEPHLQNGKKIRHSLFLCDCGNYKEINFYHFINKRVKGCGSCNADNDRQNGKKYGTITIVSFVRYDIFKSGRKMKILLGQCECGSIKEYMYNNLRTIKSCGCKAIEKNRVKFTTHGKSKHILFSVFNNMKTRCYNTKNEAYRFYGGKGVKIDNEWLNDFNLFYDWSISNGYEKGLTIERINVNGNYEPKNCKWATYTEQANNKTNTKNLLYKGHLATLAVLCRMYNREYKLAHSKLHRGYDLEVILEGDLRLS